MNFAKFNKSRVFDYDCSGFGYKSLEDLWKKNPDESKKYTIHGAYINTNSQYNDEAPVVVIDGTYVNIPAHQLPEVKAMLDDPRAITAINNGEAAFTIAMYEQKTYHKTCFKAVWCDADIDEA